MDNIVLEPSTEQRILAAAKEIFVKHGMAGARMQDIANEAGINKAMLHYYFRSKERLFEVVFREAMIKQMSLVTIIFNGDEPLFTKIEMYCSQYIETVIENPYIPLFVIHELNREPKKFIENLWLKDRKPSFKKIMAQIEEEVEKGTIRPIHPFQLILNMMSLCVFPFIGKPILQHVSGINNEQYAETMKRRKTEVAQFIIASIKT